MVAVCVAQPFLEILICKDWSRFTLIWQGLLQDCPLLNANLAPGGFVFTEIICSVPRIIVAHPVSATSTAQAAIILFIGIGPLPRFGKKKEAAKVDLATGC
jgi:hypothetical protein